MTNYKVLTYENDNELLVAPSRALIEASGARVHVTHRQNNHGGGTTHVLILTPDGYWGEGKATCGKDDVYDTDIGYTVACSRAGEQLLERGRFLEIAGSPNNMTGSRWIGIEEANELIRQRKVFRPTDLHGLITEADIDGLISNLFGDMAVFEITESGIRQVQ